MPITQHILADRFSTTQGSLAVDLKAILIQLPTNTSTLDHQAWTFHLMYQRVFLFLNQLLMGYGRPNCRRHVKAPFRKESSDTSSTGETREHVRRFGSLRAHGRSLHGSNAGEALEQKGTADCERSKFSTSQVAPLIFSYLRWEEPVEDNGAQVDSLAYLDKYHLNE